MGWLDEGEGGAARDCKRSSRSARRERSRLRFAASWALRKADCALGDC